jgi:hypothetical protein
LKKTATKYTVRDAIARIDYGTMTDDILKATVRKHAVKVYVLTFLN